MVVIVTLGIAKPFKPSSYAASRNRNARARGVTIFKDLTPASTLGYVPGRARGSRPDHIEPSAPRSEYLQQLQAGNPVTEREQARRLTQKDAAHHRR